MLLVAKSSLLFLLAGLLEIGGGYLVWRWWRAGGPWWIGAGGLICLVGVAVIMYWPR